MVWVGLIRRAEAPSARAGIERRPGSEGHLRRPAGDGAKGAQHRRAADPDQAGQQRDAGVRVTDYEIDLKGYLLILGKKCLQSVESS